MRRGRRRFADLLRYAFNPYLSREGFSPVGAPAREFHRSLPGYARTPLHHLAHTLGLGAVYVKDESSRFGLPAFKSLGVAWAMHSVPRADVFAAATDGNHGRAVAWMARQLGARAVIYVPSNMKPARRAAIAAEGARVEIVAGAYDQAVQRCARDAAAHGWQVISDTGYRGYTHIPELCAHGYLTLFDEVEEQLAAAQAARPDLVVIQCGVGGLLSAAVRHFRGRGDRAAIVAVEPDDADCLLESILSPGGEPAPAKGAQDSIMSGLNCGEVSIAAWPVNRAGTDLFLSIEDHWAEDAMRLLHPEIIAGESGAAGFAGLLALCRDPRLEAVRRQLKLGAETVALVLNTEGATDPENYRRITG